MILAATGAQEIKPIASEVIPQLAVSPTPLTQLLANLAISGIPGGKSVVQALLIITFRTIDNTNSSGNSVSGAQAIEVAGNNQVVAAFTFAGGEEAVAGSSTDNPGDALIGTADISASVGDNGSTISVYWANSKAALASMDFNDVQVILRLWVE